MFLADRAPSGEDSPKMKATAKLKDGRIEFAAPGVLGAAEARFLAVLAAKLRDEGVVPDRPTEPCLALKALAEVGDGDNGQLAKSLREGINKKLSNLGLGGLTQRVLDPEKDGTGDPRPIVIAVTPRALLSGMGLTDGAHNYAALTDIIRRTAAVSVFTTVEGKPRGTRESEGVPLMQFMGFERSGRKIMVFMMHPMFAKAARGGQHCRLDLDELRSLKSGNAALLYLRLCGMIDWPAGGKGKAKNSATFRPATLPGWLWPGPSANGNTLRSRRRRLRAAMAEIGGLPRWAVEEDADGGWKVTRLHRPKKPATRG
jgi:hypothetical protein